MRIRVSHLRSCGHFIVCPYRPLCRFSLQSFTSTHHKMQISGFWRTIPKLTLPFGRQRPCPPSCRLLSKSDNSSQNFPPENRELVCHIQVILLWMMSFHRQCPCPPSCDFHRNPSQKLRITVFKPASCTITCTERARYHIWQCHFVGNAHVLLHTNFHCNPSLPATINCE